MNVVSVVEVFAVMTQNTKASADCLIFLLSLLFMSKESFLPKFFEKIRPKSTSFLSSLKNKPIHLNFFLSGIVSLNKLGFVFHLEHMPYFQKSVTSSFFQICIL